MKDKNHIVHDLSYFYWKLRLYNIKIIKGYSLSSVVS